MSGQLLVLEEHWDPRYPQVKLDSHVTTYVFLKFDASVIYTNTAETIRQHTSVVGKLPTYQLSNPAVGNLSTYRSTNLAVGKLSSSYRRPSLLFYFF